MCDQIKVETITEHTVKARKPHDCWVCEGVIWRGEYYVRTVEKIDGEISVKCHHKSHDATIEEKRDSYLYSRHPRY